MAIFTEDFEVDNDNFNTNWTGKLTGGASTAIIEHVNPHHNLHNAKFAVQSLSYTICYKTVAAHAIGYLRVYYKLADLPANGEYISLGGLESTDWTYSIKPRLKNDAGSYYWGLRVVENSAETITWEVVASNPVISTWYALEIKRDVTNDIETLKVDDVGKVSMNVAISGNNNNITVGFDENGCATTKTCYADCVVADSSPIGLEGAGGPTIKKGSCVPAMTALLSKFSALRQPREPRFQPRTFPKFTPRTLI